MIHLKSILIDYNEIICKTWNISALLTVESQFKPTQVNPLHIFLSAFDQTSFPHSPTFIPTPTPMFTEVYPQTLPPTYNLPPPPQFVYHWTGTGRGLLSVNIIDISPFSILTPSPNFFVPLSPIFTPPTFSKRGRGCWTKIG